MSTMQWIFAGAGCLIAGFWITLLLAIGGWKLFWEFVNVLGSGAVAVNILHFTESPSYLILTLGWFCLLGCLASAATVINAVFCNSNGPCVCAICSRHRQELGA
jgi:hypothetical protein